MIPSLSNSFPPLFLFIVHIGGSIIRVERKSANLRPREIYTRRFSRRMIDEHRTAPSLDFYRCLITDNSVPGKFRSNMASKRLDKGRVYRII